VGSPQLDLPLRWGKKISIDQCVMAWPDCRVFWLMALFKFCGGHRGGEDWTGSSEGEENGCEAHGR